jgi:hypothetical protein
MLFSVVTPSLLLGKYQLFGEIYCLQSQGIPEDGDSMFLRNTGIDVRHTNPEELQQHNKYNLHE